MGRQCGGEKRKKDRPHLQVVHEVSSVSLDLLVGGDGTEDNLGEALAGEHPETDAADRTPVLDEGQRLVLRVEDEPVAKKFAT